MCRNKFLDAFRPQFDARTPRRREAFFKVEPDPFHATPSERLASNSGVYRMNLTANREV